MAGRELEIRNLKGANVELTSLGFGAAPLGDLFQQVTEEDAHATIEAAWNRGFRYFDTSPFYGHGQSEIRLGRGLYRKPREEFVLSTKVGRLFRRPFIPASFQPEGWAGGLQFKLTFDYSYDGIMRSVEDSYLRLGMNTIDMLLIHDLDEQFHPNPSTLLHHRSQLSQSGLRALIELKQAGVIKTYGAGINTRPSMKWFLENIELDFFLLALRYTLLENDVLDHELPLCEKKNIGLVIGGAFNSGILATGARKGAKYNYRDADETVIARVAEIEKVCARHEVPLVAAALQFPFGHPMVANVIPGAATSDKIDANIRAMNFAIPEGFWTDLKSSGLLRNDAPIPQFQDKLI